MSNIITVNCPTCGHVWLEDLDQAQSQQVTYRGDKKQTRVEEYIFTCPKDGTQVVAEVEREA